MRTTLTVVMASVLSNLAYSQVGINTADPITSLDVVAKTNDGSSAEGILPPRLTGDQIKAGDSQYLPQHAGVIVYATAPVGVPSTKTINITSIGLYYFDGAVWVKMMQGDGRNFSTQAAGDIKHSIQPIDHNGWYLLDGRDVSTLPTGAMNAAVSLGFPSKLPNAADRVLKTKNNVEILGSVGGSNTLLIEKENLPSVNFTGTVSGNTNAAGVHTHTMSGTATSAGAHTHSVSGTAASAGAHAHGSASGGGFLLGGTNAGNNGTGNYQGNGSPGAWGNVGIGGTTASAGAHTHSVTGTGASAGAHTHNLDVDAANAGSHTHTVTGTATVSSGGTGEALDNKSAYLVVNTFIYLGE
ncbi:hypothetical protein [Chryseobacterium wanjuense]